MTDQAKNNLLAYAKREFEKLGYDVYPFQRGPFTMECTLKTIETFNPIIIIIATKNEKLDFRIDVDFKWFGGTLNEIIQHLTKCYKRAEEDIEIVKAKMEATDAEKEKILDILKECGVPSGTIKAIERALK